MSRLGRYFLPGLPFHVIQRGNNRQPIFFAPEDYRLYLAWLGDAAAALKVKVHAYVLMTNHVHLLLTPATESGIPRLMQRLGRLYVGHVNKTYGRTGTLWEGRYRAAPIEADAYLLACYRYIELNPVRARVTRKPETYPWSSYGAHALGEAPSGAAGALIRDHATYLALGKDAKARQKAYRGLFRAALPRHVIDELRAATNGGWALGGDRFKAKVARAAGRRASPLPPGRPRNESEDAR